MHRSRWALRCALFAVVVSACGSSGGLAAQAQDQSDQTCACTTFECTMEHIAWFNKQRAVNDAEVQGLDENDRSSFDSAEDSAVVCQDALR